MVECWRSVEISVLTLALGLDQRAGESQSAVRIVTEGRKRRLQASRRARGWPTIHMAGGDGCAGAMHFVVIYENHHTESIPYCYHSESSSSATSRSKRKGRLCGV